MITYLCPDCRIRMTAPDESASEFRDEPPRCPSCGESMEDETDD